MESKVTEPDFVKDYITGKSIPLVGPEGNRQALERFLVEEKGYSKQDVVVDEKLVVDVNGQEYASRIDLVVYVENKRFMVIKCAAGSLGSREREILAAARIVENPPVPFSVVSDGKTAIVLDSVSGKNLGEGLTSLESKDEAGRIFKNLKRTPLSQDRLMKEALIFKSYDGMNVNIASGKNL
ncbi:MAG: type I restriction enzyme HsdR N-terminal domain-containing protein [Proteobacteria bacterium]|nr:type I restriction enzyme HsdR N-terminal domain-containing protein [Pseudomonadota bacterium]MBU4471359.1 type I restriction enzyme HsdR N-terminal domain-containing protein [Pseudomonadota bacterium]